MAAGRRGAGWPCQLRLPPGRLCDPRRQHRRDERIGRAFSDPHLRRLPRRRRRAGDPAGASRLRRAPGGAHVCRAASAWATALVVFLMPNQQSLDRSRPRRTLRRCQGRPAASIASVLTPSVLAMTGFFTLLALSQQRHLQLLRGRPDRHPGHQRSPRPTRRSRPTSPARRSACCWAAALADKHARHGDVAALASAWPPRSCCSSPP